MSYLLVHWSVFGVSPHQAEIVILTTGWGLELGTKVHVVLEVHRAFKVGRCKIGWINTHLA